MQYTTATDQLATTATRKHTIKGPERPLEAFLSAHGTLALAKARKKAQRHKVTLHGFMTAMVQGEH